MMNQLLQKSEIAPAPSPAKSVKSSISGAEDMEFARHLDAQGTLQEGRAAQAENLRRAMQSEHSDNHQVSTEKSKAISEGSEQWLSLVEEWRSLAEEFDLLTAGDHGAMQDSEQWLVDLSQRLHTLLQNEFTQHSVGEKPEDSAGSLSGLVEKMLSTLDAAERLVTSDSRGLELTEPELSGQAAQLSHDVIQQLHELLEALNTRLTDSAEDVEFRPFDVAQLHLSPDEEAKLAELLAEIGVLLEEGQVVYQADADALYALLEELTQRSAQDDKSAMQTTDTAQFANALAILEKMLEPQSDADSDQLSRLRNLMSELNHAHNSPGSRLLILTEREGGNNLPPVAAALSDAAKQLREQLLNVSAEAVDESSSGTGYTRIQDVVSVPLTVEPRPANLISTQNLTGSATVTTQVFSEQAQRDINEQVQTSRHNAGEVARQTQQAIDILGPGASERLRERISVMFNNRTQAAEMRLDPPDLGRLTIRLQLGQDGAAVNFQVSNPQAREAIEQNLSRLRELLQEQGIQLADANVSEQSDERHRGHGSFVGQFGGADGIEGDLELADEDAEPGRIEIPVTSNDGRVDYYV